MEIEKTLKEIAKYVASKILNNDFEFIACNDYNSILKMDNIEFKIWTANGFRCLDFSGHDTFIQNVGVSLFENDAEKQTAWNILEPHIKQYTYAKDLLIEQKMEVENLKNV